MTANRYKPTFDRIASTNKIRKHLLCALHAMHDETKIGYHVDKVKKALQELDNNKGLNKIMEINF